VERLRRLNFGIRSLSQPLSVEAVSAAIAAYDPVDAARVSQQIRGSASSEFLHQGLLSLYESVITEHASRRGRTDWREESRAAAAYLHRVNASRPGDAGLNLVVRAAHRLLRTPLLGRALTRVARWIVDAGRAGGNRGS